MMREYFVYWCYSHDGLLYIGCTKNLTQRYVAHRSSSEWFGQASYFRIAAPYVKDVARAIETAEIKSRRPPNNTVGAGRSQAGAPIRLSRSAVTTAWAASGLDEDDLRDALGVTAQYMRRLLTARAEPSQLMAARLARILRTTLRAIEWRREIEVA